MYPITLQQKTTAANGLLELVLYQGKKMLNSPKANYSYGSLQRVFELALENHPPQFKVNQRVLILGFGAGSIQKVLLEAHHFTGTVTGVEYDKELTEWVRPHFEKYFDNVTLEHCDALSFLEKNKNPFDFIFVDLFCDLKCAPVCFEGNFYSLLKQNLLPNGCLYHNTMGSTKQLGFIKQQYQQQFGNLRSQQFLGSNTVFYGRA